MHYVQRIGISGKRLCHMLGGGVRAVLVATGSLLSVSPDRVICKRIILSGHPYKINRKSAVIRYLFFNRGKH